MIARESCAISASLCIAFVNVLCALMAVSDHLLVKVKRCGRGGERHTRSSPPCMQTHTDTHPPAHTHAEKGRQADRQTARQTDRQTDR